jgi:hypothetical protein
MTNAISDENALMGMDRIQGSVMPISRHSLGTSEGGRMDKIFMEAGTMVKKGEPILELVNTDLLLNILGMIDELTVFENVELPPSTSAFRSRSGRNGRTKSSSTRKGGPRIWADAQALARP